MQVVLTQTLHQFWAPVVAVAQCPTIEFTKQLLGHGQFVNVGWCQFKVGNDARPGDTQVGSHSKELLTGNLIMTIRRNGAQPATVSGAGKAADWHRQAVYDMESWVELNMLQQRPSWTKLAGWPKRNGGTAAHCAAKCIRTTSSSSDGLNSTRSMSSSTHAVCPGGK